jgi:16S rRNA (guanine966-N2)-methyltransferase
MRIGAGRWKNARLPTAGPDVRPVPGRLRTSLFSVLADRIEGARVLDLCAGVGGLGLEALSRGAASCVLVDWDRRAVEALARWAREHDAQRVVRPVVAEVATGRFPKGPYDLVFLDPPFSAWEDGSARNLLAQAVGAVTPQGRVAVKVPQQAVLPEDPGWEVVDRRDQGSVGYVLLRRGRGATPGVKGSGGQADPNT